VPGAQPQMVAKESPQMRAERLFLYASPSLYTLCGMSAAQGAACGGQEEGRRQRLRRDAGYVHAYAYDTAVCRGIQRAGAPAHHVPVLRVGRVRGNAATPSVG